MALPNPLANPIAFFGTAFGQHTIFPFIRPRAARNLLGLIRVIAPEHHYVHCDLTCEDGEIPNALPAAPGWSPTPPLNHPAAAAQIICHRKAKFTNALSADDYVPNGYNEPSYCEEPRNTPNAGTHALPHPGGRPLVCHRCKDRRATKLEWKKEYLLFGVCKTCRKWALENMDPGQSDCTCLHLGNGPHGKNNNEERYKHLCRLHADAYWNQLRPVAQAETNLRMVLMRQRAPKKTGNGWTKKKQHGPKPVRTPQERRAATQQRATNYLEPRCFCGEDVGPNGHSNLGPGPGPIDSGRVRNCVGCNEFVRRF